jgi:hypothetical protein
MTKLPNEEFINTNIGKIDYKSSWNSIPTNQIKEFIPAGESIEQQNKIKENLREYYQRVNRVLLTGLVTAITDVYTVPDNFVFLIDAVAISFYNGTAALRDGGIQLILSGAGGSYFMNVIAAVGTTQNQSLTFNNPVRLESGTTIRLQQSGVAGGQIAYTINGWLQDKALSN